MHRSIPDLRNELNSVDRGFCSRDVSPCSSVCLLDVGGCLAESGPCGFGETRFVVSCKVSGMFYSFAHNVCAWCCWCSVLDVVVRRSSSCGVLHVRRHTDRVYPFSKLCISEAWSCTITGH
ncbi:unnamed protein product [Sphacelaria rigidula]